MARETKVGMLAGLTFIICFAIILSNRGGRALVTSDVSALFEDGNHEGESAARPSQFPQTSQISRMNPMSSGSRQATTGYPHEVPGLSQSRSDQAGPAATDADANHHRNSGGEAETTAQRNRIDGPGRGAVLAVPSSDTDSRVARLERKLERLSRAMRRGQSSVPAMGDGVEKSPPTQAADDSVPLRRAPNAVYHQVRAGETLSKIAAEHYGSRSPRFIDAIFDANRAILATPDEIKVGMELLLPALGDSVPQRTAEPVQPPNEDKETRDRSFRWYQIKKNDRYVTIAGEQLGDRSRWKEIYELNRGVFPDAGLIREGVLIKLPAVASAGERR